MKYERLNAYRIMWVLVFYDLPTSTEKERKAAAEFRKKILQDGFTMFQFSMYVRHCSSAEHAQRHVSHINKILPALGHVGIITITDKQFGMMKIFSGKKPIAYKNVPQQLEIF